MVQVINILRTGGRRGVGIFDPWDELQMFVEQVYPLMIRPDQLYIFIIGLIRLKVTKAQLNMAFTTPASLGLKIQSCKFSCPSYTQPSIML